MNIKAGYFMAVSMIAFMSAHSALMAMEELTIDRSHVSKNCCPRGDLTPEVLIFHCVGYSDKWVFKNYVFPENEGGMAASAHFYIPESGDKIYELVSPSKTAYHAGASEWRGLVTALNLSGVRNLPGLNKISLGIEFQSPSYALINTKPYYPYSFASFSEEQINHGIELSKQIMKSHNISSENVVWHSDVSPMRGAAIGKTDPGPNFPAKRFAQAGVGVWPSSDRLEDSQLDISLTAIQTNSQKWGYPHIQPTGIFDEPTKYVLAAHYMHYLPKEVNWELFKEQQSGSVFDSIEDWDSFSKEYSVDTLAISLENLNTKHFVFNEQ